MDRWRCERGQDGRRETSGLDCSGQSRVGEDGSVPFVLRDSRVAAESGGALVLGLVAWAVPLGTVSVKGAVESGVVVSSTLTASEFGSALFEEVETEAVAAPIGLLHDLQPLTGFRHSFTVEDIVVGRVAVDARFDCLSVAGPFGSVSELAVGSTGRLGVVSGLAVLVTDWIGIALWVDGISKGAPRVDAVHGSGWIGRSLRLERESQMLLELSHCGHEWAPGQSPHVADVALDTGWEPRVDLVDMSV
jgi:hypothetical protein